MKTKNYLSILCCALLLNACGGDKNTGTTTTKPTTQSEKPKPVDEVKSTATFGHLLVELESNVGWSAVTSEWKDRRNGWISECETATDSKAKANLLMEFESNLKWEAVDPRWADRREAWILDLEKAANEGDLGKYLAELEEYIIWDVVSPNWANVREGWIQNCKDLAKGEW